MNKNRIILMFIVLNFLSVVHAAEMFSSYPKRFALGYAASAPELRYWFNDRWGISVIPNYDRDKYRSKTSTIDSVRNSELYSISLGAVRGIRNYECFDLNIKFLVGYTKLVDAVKNTNHAVIPETVTRDRIKSEIYSISVGPEVEIKVPYFSRLRLSSSIQARYSFQGCVKSSV